MIGAKMVEVWINDATLGGTGRMAHVECSLQQ